MADVIQLRRDTASNWTSANPTLASGELGLETDTGKLKLGTGALAWNSASYYTLATTGYAPLASPTFTGTVTGPTINASTALQIGGAAVTSTAPELNILDGVTSTTAELNILDGVTSTAAELNKLDGVTATTAELNYVDGVTSAIQTQIDTKGTVSNLSDLSITSTAAELNKLDGLARGSIIYGNASAATTALTKGTADQVLTSDGTDIAWADAGGGGGSGWTYLSTITANANQIDYTGISSTYDDYMVIFNDIQGSYTGHDFYCYFKMGSVWHAEGTGTNSTSECYHYLQRVMTLGSGSISGSSAGTVASPATRIKPIIGGCMSNNTGEGFSGVLYLPNVNGSEQKSCYSRSTGIMPYNNKWSETHACIKSRASPSVVATNALTGIRFKLSNGTMTGTFKFYGLAKS